jgi:hypothetical protein
MNSPAASGGEFTLREIKMLKELLKNIFYSAFSANSAVKGF